MLNEWIWTQTSKLIIIIFLTKERKRKKNNKIKPQLCDFFIIIFHIGANNCVHVNVCFEIKFAVVEEQWYHQVDWFFFHLILIMP